MLPNLLCYRQHKKMYCDQVVALELVHVYAFYILGNSGELRRSVDTKRTKVSERFKLHFIGFQCQSKVIIFLLILETHVCSRSTSLSRRE